MESQEKRELGSRLKIKQQLKQNYHKPQLTKFGDIRAVTLGPSTSTDIESDNVYPTGYYPI